VEAQASKVGVGGGEVGVEGGGGGWGWGGGWGVACIVGVVWGLLG
jgi:hypothetical protein